MKVKYKNIVCSISFDSANMFFHLHSAQVIFFSHFLKGEYLMGEVGGLMIIT